MTTQLAAQRLLTDALIQRLQALGLRPGASILLRAESIPPVHLTMLGAFEACGALALMQRDVLGVAYLQIGTGPAAHSLFAMPEIIAPASPKGQIR